MRYIFLVVLMLFGGASLYSSVFSMDIEEEDHHGIVFELAAKCAGYEEIRAQLAVMDDNEKMKAVNETSEENWKPIYLIARDDEPDRRTLVLLSKYDNSWREDLLQEIMRNFEETSEEEDSQMAGLRKDLFDHKNSPQEFLDLVLQADDNQLVDQFNLDCLFDSLGDVAHNLSFEIHENAFDPLDSSAEGHHDHH